MQTIDVSVTFEGVVTVQVPDHLDKEAAEKLASKLVTARILATTENPDAPEDAACEEGEEEDWDACEITGVMGTWRG